MPPSPAAAAPPPQQDHLLRERGAHGRSCCPLRPWPPVGSRSLALQDHHSSSLPQAAQGVASHIPGTQAHQQAVGGNTGGMGSGARLAACTSASPPTQQHLADRAGSCPGTGTGSGYGSGSSGVGTGSTGTGSGYGSGHNTGMGTGSNTGMGSGTGTGGTGNQTGSYGVVRPARCPVSVRGLCCPGLTLRVVQAGMIPGTQANKAKKADQANAY